MTGTASECTQPGCSGTIDGGYCNVCGLAPARRSASGPGPAASAPRGSGAPAAAAPAHAAGCSGPSTRYCTVVRAGRRTGPGPRHHRRQGRSRLGGDRQHRAPVAAGQHRPVVPGQPGRGPGRDPAGPRPRPGQRRARRPAGAGEQAVLRELRAAGRPQPGRPARADRGFLPELRHPVLVQPRSCRRATWSPASTRCSAAWRTAASAGSTWPRTATSATAGWCSRACSTPATPTPWRPRSPSGSSSPRSSTRTSSGSTTSSSTPTATGERPATS